MEKVMKNIKFPDIRFLLLFLGGALILSLSVTCGGSGGGSSTSTATTGSVQVSISDPPTCLVPNGNFQNVWVTITRVRAHVSSTAASTDSGWVELVDLRNNPVQLDLLSLSSPACLLTVLGTATGVPSGTYQQIRIVLLSNSPVSGESLPAVNNCDGSGLNCVVTAGNATQPLLLSSEAQTGIKIPPGQIAGGSFVVSSGLVTNLNIDFDACSSIVRQGSGQFRLKPALHAGQVSLTVNSIRGRVVDRFNNGAIPNAIVFAEQGDPSTPSIDRVIAQTTTGGDGSFTLCLLPSGTFDVVVTAKTAIQAYSAAVTLQVPVGTIMGNIPLTPQPNVPPATIAGLIQATNVGGALTTADASLSALQAVNSQLVTIPPLENSTPDVAVDGTAIYALNIPATNPSVGVFSASPPTFYAPPATGGVLYWVNARAFTPMNAALNPGGPDCSPSSLPVVFDSTTQRSVSPGSTTTQDFFFTACQ
jgi:Domain of unknown function (DUF4382)/Carboxypeptidase regulatory-like domain